MTDALPFSHPLTSLEQADLSHKKPDDLQRFIVNSVFTTLLNSPASPYIDSERLQGLLNSHLDALISGRSFDVVPLFHALLRVPEITEEKLYVATLNLKETLRQRRVTLVDPPFSLDQTTRARLLEAAHAETELARQAYHEARLEGAVRDLNRARLGDLLVDHGIITQAELGEALDAQKRTGGRLGSNLVELGYVDAKLLARFLGEQLGLPFRAEIGRVPSEAVAAIPAEIAAKHRVMPLEIDKQTLCVAMIDPTKLLVVDELAKITGLHIEPVVAPELAIRYAMARYYGIEQPARFILRDPSSRLSETGQFELVHTEPPQSSGQHKALLDLSRRLLEADSSEAVLQSMLHHLSRQYQVVALFLLHAESAEAWAQVGAEVSGQSFRGQSVALTELPGMRAAQEQGEIQRFESAEAEAIAWLQRTLQLKGEGEVVLMPFQDMGRRVSAVAVCQRPRSPNPERDQKLKALGSAGLALVALKQDIQKLIA